jgi:hypothetical protein
MAFAQIMLSVMGPAAIAGCSGGSNAGSEGTAEGGAIDPACLPTIVSASCYGVTAAFPCGYDGGPPTGVGAALPAEICSVLCADPEQYATLGPPPGSCGFSQLSSQIPPGGQGNVGCNDRQCGTGRKPRGLLRARLRPALDPVAAWLARTAHLEAASITSFERLEADLARYGAPRSLIARVRRAVGDEVRHARATTRLAAARGATTPRVRVRPVARAPSLSELAVENAAEGCVNETYGALVATWQAAHAHDDAIRVAMARIAVDEVRHALLAWAIDAWAWRRLDASERQGVSRARARAALALLRSVERSEPSPEAVRDAGLPPREIARALCVQLQRFADS